MEISHQHMGAVASQRLHLQVKVPTIAVPLSKPPNNGGNYGVQQQNESSAIKVFCGRPDAKCWLRATNKMIKFACTEE